MSSEEERAMIAELTNPRDGRRIRQNAHHGLFRSQLAKPRRVRQSTYQQTSTHQGEDPGMGRRMKQLSNLAGFFGQVSLCTGSRQSLVSWNLTHSKLLCLNTTANQSA